MTAVQKERDVDYRQLFFDSEKIQKKNCACHELVIHAFLRDLLCEKVLI